MRNTVHHIQQQSIEIHFAEVDQAVGIQDHIADVFYTKLQPQMEALFDELAGDRYLISLDRLEVDCGVLPDKGWEEEWVDTAIRKLKEELLTVHRKALPAEGPTADSAENAFFFFLEQGHLPWHKNGSSIKELEALLSVNAAFIARLKLFISEKHQVIRRLVHHVSDNFLEKLVIMFVGERKGDWQQIQSIVHRVGEQQSTAFREAVLKAFSERDETPVLHFLRGLHSHADPAGKRKIEKITAEELKIGAERLQVNQKQLSPDDGPKPGPIYIRNAGLVLLHPFLPPLFQITGLIEKEKWVEEASRHKAIQLLQYLVTGEDEYNESHYPLNKILCGINPASVADNNGLLSEAAKAAGEEMLKEVIGYWKVLKNTGTQAFRETFLQRAGKLSIVDNGWLLQVEQKSPDILLNYLPWGIGIIKLPWMKEMLYVEWV